MGINAVVSENYASDNLTKSATKKQSDAFKSLIDMAAKKQSSQKAGDKTNCGTDSKTVGKTDAKADKTDGAEVKPKKNEEDEVDKKDEVFENEKNSFIEQAFLARNAVDVVNIEVEPVQGFVLTAAAENEEIIPQIGEVPLTGVAQNVESRSVVDMAGQEAVAKENLAKTPEINKETKTDVVQDEKSTFKLEETMPKAVLPEKKVGEAEVKVDNLQPQAQNEVKTQDDVSTQKAVAEIKVEDENIYAKKDNLEIKSEAQIITSSGKDVIVIKVADPVTPSTGKEIAEKLGDEIVVKLDSGANEFQAVLNPKGLGEIAVKLSVESGKVMVSMTCSKETTKALLENNVSSLVKIVEGKMGQETVVNVYNGKDSSQENFDGQGNKGQYQGNSQHNQGNNDEPETDFIQKLRLGILGMEMEEV